MRTIFSHIIFAALAVIAVGSYFHWEEILSGVGSRVCSDEVLGLYGPSKTVALGGTAAVSQKIGSSEKPAKPVGPPARLIGRDTEKPLQEALDDARQSYWDDKNEDAEAQFLALIARFPENPDIKGELGNVYYKVGQQTKAAAQYYDAGVIWVRTGKHDRAKDIIKLLRDLDPAKSERLRLALASTG